MALHAAEHALLGLLARLLDEPAPEEESEHEASRTIISGPPTNSPSVNCQPRTSAIRMPSSTTRFVEANSKAIAAVKSAPRRKSERASATAA